MIYNNCYVYVDPNIILVSKQHNYLCLNVGELWRKLPPPLSRELMVHKRGEGPEVYLTVGLCDSFLTTPEKINS